MPDRFPAELPIGSIQHGRNSRVVVDPVRDKELAASVRTHGVLQPIRVRPVDGQGTYEIIAGHRRFEAAISAKLAKIPVVVATPSDSEAFVESLVENLQRRDLDPLDEARAFQAIIDEQAITQEALGKLVGRTQSEISNSLALLKLEPEVAAQLSAGKITVGHARVIARHAPAVQSVLASEAVDRKMTVRDIEARSADMKASADRKAARAAILGQIVPEWDELLKAKGVAKSAAVLVYDQDLVVPLRAFGWKSARPVDIDTDTPNPQFSCTCEAVWLSSIEKLIVSACVVRDHAKAADDVQKVAEKEVAGVREKLLNRVRRASIKALHTDDGLNVDGLRVALYVQIMTTTSAYDVSRKAFVERHGGTWPATGEQQYLGDTVWEAIGGLSSKDLVEELLDRIIGKVIPNVFAGSSYTVAEHAAVRQYLVDQFGAEAVIVWGEHEPWVPRVGAWGSAAAFDKYDAPIVHRRIGARVALEDSVQLADGSEYRVLSIIYPGEAPPVVRLRAPGGVDAQVLLSQLVADKGFWHQVVPVEPEGQDESPKDGLPDVDSSAEAVDLIALAAETPPVGPVPVDSPPVAAPFEGLTVVVTGVIEGMDRSDVEQAVNRAGGRAASAVTVSTNLLVIGEKPGAVKLQRARDLGIRTISGEQFRQVLRGNESF